MDENIIVYYDPVSNNIWTGVFYTSDYRYYLIGPDDLALELLSTQKNKWIPDHFVMIGRLNG